MQQFFESFIPGPVGNLSFQPQKHFSGGSLPGDRVPAQTRRMERQSGDVHTLINRGSDGVDQSRGETTSGRVRHDHIPTAIDHDGRVGLVSAQDEFEHITHLAHRGRPEIRPLIGRGEPGRQEKLVSLLQRDVQDHREMEHHLPAWCSPSRFEKRQVPLGHGSFSGQLQLTESPLRSPVFQFVSKRCWTGWHEATLSKSRSYSII